jgi:SAM-dependent methyltransferase
MIGVQRVAKISAPRAIGQYWPYVRTATSVAPIPGPHKFTFELDRVRGGGIVAAMDTTTIWALGDYPRVAREVVWDMGAALVSACDIGPGGRVLDVAAGTGNAAMRAAEAGAQVVACDLEPALLEVGRRASNRGAIEWVQADAQALPFADGEFDAVVSCIGAMFAPDHRATGAELLRVCKPGGTIGMANWTPEGMVGAFFELFAPYGPPADGPPPVAWGSEDHVRALFGEHVESLRLERANLVVDHFARPADLCDYYRRNFGPTMAAYAAVADDPERRAALDRDFLEFAERWHRGGAYELEYLLVVARTATSA